jgi:hypothetical protein
MGKFKQRPPPSSKQRPDQKKQSFVDAVFGPLKSKRQGGGNSNGGGSFKNATKKTAKSPANKAATPKVRKGRGPQDSVDAPMHSQHHRTKELKHKPPQPLKRPRSSSGGSKEYTAHRSSKKRPRSNSSTSTVDQRHHRPDKAGPFRSPPLPGGVPWSNSNRTTIAAAAAAAAASVKHLRLPNATSNVKIPWWNAQGKRALAALDTSSKPRTQRGKGANCRYEELLAPYVTAWLDDELDAFGHYVQLTAVEREARSTLIAHIAQLATNVFGDAVASTTWSSTPVQCQVFGSFATLPVCTFASDVDLALWGVVEPLYTTTVTGRSPPTTTTTTTTRTKKRPMPDNVGTATAAAQAVSTTQSTMIHSESEPVVTNTTNVGTAVVHDPAAERKRRWQAALAAIDDANANTNGHDDDDDNEKSDLGGAAFTNRSGISHGDRREEVRACVEPNAVANTKVSVMDRSGSDAFLKGAPCAPAKDPIDDDSSTVQNTTTAESDRQATAEDTLQETTRTDPPLQNSTTANSRDCTGVELDDDDDDDETLFIIDRVGEAQTVHSSPTEEQSALSLDKIESLTDNHDRTDSIEETRPVVVDQVGCGGLLERAGAALAVSGTTDHVVSPPLTTASSVDSDDDDDDDDDDDEVDNDGDENDDADPLESLLSQALQCSAKAESKQSLEARKAMYFHDTDGANDDDSSDDDAEDLEYRNPQNEDDDEGSESAASLSDMHVSFVTDKPPMATMSTPDGPQGRKREEVIRALASLSNKLRKSKLTTRVQLIKRARVPIIKVETRLGFEADIAVGGHNGADTSLYASTQVQKYSRQVKRTLAANEIELVL